MPLILRQRNPTLAEIMDDPDCNPVTLRRTYKRFRFLNRTLARWKKVFRYQLLPLMDENRSWTLLDVGCGGCDVAVLLAALAEKHHIKLQITAIDPNPVAAGYVRDCVLPESVQFRSCHTSDLITEGKCYDFIISNHVLHHLDPNEIRAFARDTERLCLIRAVHNDLSRSDFAWLAFAMFAWPVTIDTFNFTDGLRSIRRSYIASELMELFGHNWSVFPLYPFRNLVIYDAGNRH